MGCTGVNACRVEHTSTQLEQKHGDRVSAILLERRVLLLSNMSCFRNQQRDRRDVWNARLLQWCRYDGDFEMPCLPVCRVIPTRLTAFSEARTKSADESFIHCYEDDYRFERLWREPSRYLPLIRAYGGAIAPDFSVYREMPLPQQMYNVFRSRVIGYWWSRSGVTVVPNVRWGDERTYKFCFDGLPTDSVLAFGTHGCVKHVDDRRHVLDGFLVMLERLAPKAVIVYGSASEKIFPPMFARDVEIIRFESGYSRSHLRKTEVI